MKSFILLWNGKGKRLDFRTSLDDESFGAIAVAGLYELSNLLQKFTENNPMLGTIEASVVQKESRKTDESDENKEVTNEKNNNKFAVELLIELEISGKRGLKATPFWKTKDGQKISVYCSQN